MIWTYFKNAPIDYDLITEEISTLLTFKKKISDLGHFPTNYSNISDLKYQFRNQLDKVLFRIANPAGTAYHPAAQAAAFTTELVRNTFNEQLTKKLIETIQVYSPRAQKFLENVNRLALDWELQPRFSDKQKKSSP